MTRFQPSSANWELQEARVRLEMLDAAIRAHQQTGQQDKATRLMRVRRAIAAKAAEMATQAVQTRAY